jgi:hypothetical protein
MRSYTNEVRSAIAKVSVTDILFLAQRLNLFDQEFDIDIPDQQAERLITGILTISLGEIVPFLIGEKKLGQSVTMPELLGLKSSELRGYVGNSSAVEAEVVGTESQ